MRPIETIDAGESKPPRDHSVIVAGGVARWDGERWHSVATYPYGGSTRPIEWEVKWWAYFPQDSQVLG